MGGPSGQYPFGGWWRSNSIAGQPHGHAREIARRQRQAERDERRQAERLAAAHKRGHVPPPQRVGSGWAPVVGLSRRGRYLVGTHGVAP